MIYKRDGHTAHTCREMHILHRRGSEECRRYIYKRDARTHFKEIYKREAHTHFKEIYKN